MVCFSIQFMPLHASCPAHILIMSNLCICTAVQRTLTSLIRMTHFVHMGSSMSKMQMGEGTCGRVSGHVSRGCGCVAEARGARTGDGTCGKWPGTCGMGMRHG